MACTPPIRVVPLNMLVRFDSLSPVVGPKGIILPRGAGGQVTRLRPAAPAGPYTLQYAADSLPSAKPVS